MYRLFLLIISVNGLFQSLSQKSHESFLRVFRGKEVEIHKYPYATFLYLNVNKPTSCGASLIMVQAVLTSASCMDEMKEKNGGVTAFFGATVPRLALAMVKVVDYIVHPKYNEKDGSRDIAVAYLEKRVPLHSAIMKIPLAAIEVKAGSTAVSAGWGKQRFDMTPDYSIRRKLREAKQEIISTEDCRQYTNRTDFADVICATDVAGKLFIDDTGNGLVVSQPTPTLIGVFSHSENGVAIFTSVISARDWIQESCHTLYINNCNTSDPSVREKHLQRIL